MECKKKHPLETTIKKSYPRLSNINILVTQMTENKVVKVWTLAEIGVSLLLADYYLE